MGILEGIANFLLDFAQRAWAAAVHLFGENLAVAMLLAILMSLLSTQFFKMLPPIARIKPRGWRIATVQVYSWLLALVVMLLMYKAPLPQYVVVSVVVAWIPSALYWLLAQLLWWKAQWIARSMSGDPQYLSGLPQKKSKPVLSIAFLALAVGAVALPVNGRAAGQGAPVAAARITVHDPLTGTHTYTEALDRVQYSGGLPQRWSITTASGQHTGTLASLRYASTGPGHWRADVVYQAWVQGRVFAAGFEQ